MNSQLPVKTTEELVTLAKKQPGAIAFGSPGFGGTPHLLAEMFQLSTDTEMLLVPYKGSGPAITDLVAGQIQIMFVGLPATEALIEKGALRLIATAESSRTTLLPDLPTIKEAGYDGVTTSGWYGILAPSGLPDEIAQRIASAMTEVVKEDDVIERFTTLGIEPLVSTPAGFDKLYRADRERWGTFITENKGKFNNK